MARNDGSADGTDVDGGVGDGDDGVGNDVHYRLFSL